MSNTILYFPPPRNELDQDLIDLKIASETTWGRLETFRARVGKIVGADYMFLLLEYLFEGKSILQHWYNPINQPLPHQYQHHLNQMDIRELQLFLRTISAIIKKTHSLTSRSRRELFYLRSEVIRKINGNISR